MLDPELNSIISINIQQQTGNYVAEIFFPETIVTCFTPSITESVSHFSNNTHPVSN